MNLKTITVLVILIASAIFVPKVALSQSMMAGQKEATNDNHTAREEAEGKAVWERLQTKQITCDRLSDGDFETLGEYFMGQMTGASHEAMNTMMERMMGKDSEEQMHIVMGKRLGGCDTSAQFPQNGVGFVPMMWMMGGGGNPMVGYGGWNNMMGWNGFGLLGWISMLLFWVLLILGVVALLRYLSRSGQHDNGKTPLEILKEQYARGEIDKKEFEQMKKDIS